MNLELLRKRVKAAQQDLSLVMYFVLNYPEELPTVEGKLSSASSCLMDALEQVNEEMKK